MVLFVSGQKPPPLGWTCKYCEFHSQSNSIEPCISCSHERFKVVDQIPLNPSKLYDIQSSLKIWEVPAFFSKIKQKSLDFYDFRRLKKLKYANILELLESIIPETGLISHLEIRSTMNVDHTSNFLFSTAIVDQELIPSTESYRIKYSNPKPFEKCQSDYQIALHGSSYHRKKGMKFGAFVLIGGMIGGIMNQIPTLYIALEDLGRLAAMHYGLDLWFHIGSFIPLHYFKRRRWEKMIKNSTIFDEIHINLANKVDETVELDYIVSRILQSIPIFPHPVSG